LTETDQGASVGKRGFVGSKRFRALMLLVVGCTAVLCILVFRGQKSVPLAWARRRGWGAAHIVKTTLATKGLSKMLGANWRNLPFEISAEEEADANQCVKLARNIHSHVNRRSVFDSDQTRLALEGVLSRRQGYFYAEFLLGIWHRNNGDEQKSREYLERSFQHAPRIIVQPYQFADGRPAAGARLRCFALECNRVKNASLDPSLNLYYPDLVTDEAGCIYLPVYETVYRTDHMASPAGHATKYPRLGWFQSRTKVGILPAAIVTAKQQPPAPPASQPR
jgi:hypothetical protein